MDVGVWLRGLGLGQYEDAFRDNGVDGSVLPKLTIDDLKELGVTGVGHRRKMMTAIGELNAPTPPQPEPIRPEPVQASATAVAPADSAERRQLTVMFCDLVGSTALSARLDPEDMRRVIRAYQDAVSGVVARYDGFVAKFMGDGVLAYFGFPRAHEDDAARAVLAGLEIARVVAGLSTPEPEKLAVRIGVATGLVVVGDIIGEGAAKEQAVVGDTPNLAARLQGLAEAGGVVVSAATRRLVGDAFRLKDLGRHAVKGLAEPVDAFAALGVVASESRFEAAHAARLTGFVGRQAEAADLIARQRRAWEGRGQIVLISGEAGIGKSRLSAWVAEQAAEIPHTKLRYQCSPYHRDSALYPFAQQFERAAVFATQDDLEVKLDKLEKVLALATDRLDEVAPLIAAMLSIPTGSRYPPQNLSPAQQRRQTLFALLDQMEGLAKKQPVLMLFEDAHWADATSLEVIDLAIERMRKLPVLLLITFRPEFAAPWKGLPDVADIALGRLERADAEGLVNQVTGGRKLPAEVLAQIVAKTDGVPLFVEELTKNVLESGLLVEDGERYRLDGPLPPLAIPSTLQDSLMARLDRLAAVKEIAQIGAAIGREFSYALLQAVVGRDETTLRVALAQLEESELVFRAGEPPAARYTFKHALVQDTAYESLLKSRRQILHQRIAEALRDRFLDVVDAEPELIAEHYTRAGLTEPAIVHWGKAGDLALRRSAFKEAIAHLGKAIEMTEAGAGKKEKTGGKLKLQVAYGNALFGARGLGAPETSAAFARASELAASAADSPEQYSVAHGLWAGAIVRGELGPARQHALSFLHQVSGDPHSPEAGVAHRINGITNLVAGELVEARHHLDQALSIFNPRRDRDLAFRFGHDAAVSTSSFLAITLWLIGEFERARRLIDETATRITQIDHLASIAQGHVMIANLEVMRQDFAKIAPRSEALAILLSDHDMPLWQAQATFYEGCVAWHAGDSCAGLKQMRLGLAQCREQKLVFLVQIFMTALASAESQGGEHSTALATIEEAIDISRRTGFVIFDAESHRTRGEILAREDPSNPAPAEAAFLAAIAVAQSQKARSFELRAALALAKLYQSTDRLIEAHDVLGPAVEGFSPTSEFPEIAQANMLLAALGETEAVKAASASTTQRVRLQLSYGNALLGARGWGSLETTAAFIRGRELTTGIESIEEHFSVLYGLWSGSYVRGELVAFRELAAQMLRLSEGQSNLGDASNAHRVSGATHYYAGELTKAREQYEKALALFDPERDRDLKFRYYADIGVSAMGFSAAVHWALGDVERARQLSDDAVARSDQSNHVGTLSLAHVHRVSFEIIRRDPARAAPSAAIVAGLAQDNEMPQFVEYSHFSEAWAAWTAGDPKAVMAAMREGMTLRRKNRIVVQTPVYAASLAEAEAKAGETEAALATLDDALAETQSNGQLYFDSELYCIRGNILLKQSPADPAPAEAAFLNAIAVAQSQKARSFELRAALALARLYQSTNRPVEAHDILGPALQGFSPTLEFPEFAEAKALFEALAGDETVKSEDLRRAQRVKLQLAYGNALIADRGHGAPEAKAAFERALALVETNEDSGDRLAIIRGLWVGSFDGGELDAMREHAAALLRETAALPNSPEAGFAHRVNGITAWFVGDLVGARGHLEQALPLHDPLRDRDLAYRFGLDPGIAAMGYLSLTLWPLGEVHRARGVVGDMMGRMSGISHVPTIAVANAHAALFEMMRGDPVGTAPFAEEAARLAREHGMKLWAAHGEVLQGWSIWQTGNNNEGRRRMRGGLALSKQIGSKVFDPFYGAMLAEAEGKSGEWEAALTTIDDAIAAGSSFGQHWFEAELHRIRGVILLKQTSADPAAAEVAFLAAIAVAQSQKSRSFQLRAGLSLAKLYQSTDRPLEADGILGPALEGFSPTPEFPEIAEAKALLEALAQTDAVRSATAKRKQRVDLHVAYGAAVLQVRGMGAPETKAAFERARELSALAARASRPEITFGLWVNAEGNGELDRMRAYAAAFQRDVEDSGSAFLAAVAHRVHGLTKFFTGDYVGARIDLEQAVAMSDPALEGELAIGFNGDPRVMAMGYLACVLWSLGEVEQARLVAEDLTLRIEQLPQLVSVAFGRVNLALFEMIRGDFERTALHLRALTEIDRKHELPKMRIYLMPHEGWIAWQRGDRDDGLQRMRLGVSGLAEVKYICFDGLFKSKLAEAEAESGNIDAALSAIDSAIALADRTGQRNFDAVVHRTRGEILRGRDPAAAEAAFLAAIAIAQQQKARSFELLAALSLAKLYQSTKRPTEAHHVLGPALDGFSPTPEFPEIAAAQALLSELSVAVQL